MCEESVKSNQKFMEEVIFAAGGIVWKQSPQGPEVAIVHRTRYGGEWGLPKGKFDPAKDKTLEDTARREVGEETGRVAKITSFAGTADYMVDNKPKVVLFWNMDIEGECPMDSKEVDKTEWLPPEKAIDKLDHAEEKNLLTKACYGDIPTLRQRFCGWIKRLVAHKQYRRLADSLKAYRPELEHRICMTHNSNQSNQCWVNAARQLLAQVESALSLGDVDGGWKCFHAAQRMEVFALTDVELKTKASILRQEATKLSPWRKEASYELLGEIKCPKSTITKEEVYQAALLRDEHSNNLYYKIGLLEKQLAYLATIMFFVVVATFFFLTQPTPATPSLSAENNVTSESKPAPQDKDIIPGVLLFGLLGGTLSAAFSIGKSTLLEKIPDLITTFWISLVRVLVGSGSALVIFVFLKAGILQKIVSPDIDKAFAAVANSTYIYYAISLVAGFSERFVLRTVEFVTKDKEKK